MSAPLAVAPRSEFGGTSYELTSSEFELIAELAYLHSRIVLQRGKEGLVLARLSKRLRALEIPTFTKYLEYLERDVTGEELSKFIDLLTTNKTHFFREKAHFDFFTERLIPDHLRTREPLRVWSAGCSTGEEPYTLAMLLHETNNGAAAQRARILATDISSKVVTQASAGVYAAEQMKDIPIHMVRKYFTPLIGQATPSFKVADQVRAHVQFARLNLFGSWPMKHTFHAIFCRNVMIYFDRDTQERLVKRFREMLAPGGYLFVGHSESLSSIDHGLSYVAPALYVK